MIAALTCLYTLALVAGGAIVRFAKTWAGERTGWLLVFVSSGFLMSLAARS